MMEGGCLPGGVKERGCHAEQEILYPCFESYDFDANYSRIVKYLI